MTTESFPKASRRAWIGLAVIALPCLLYSMDLTVLNLAVPHIVADLAPSSAEQLWIIDIYGFVLAGSLITMGTLGDRIGRRRLLMIGAAAFGAASVLAAFAWSARMLIVSRAVLGVAGATLAPSTLALIRTMFADPRQRMFAIGVWTASFSAGAALGPVLGGVLLEHFWWGSVFLLGVPVMALLLAIGPVLLPEVSDPHAGRLDVRSAAMALGAVLLVILGIKQLANHGSSASAAAAIVGGVALGAVFVRRQQLLPSPLIDLQLFRRPAFSAALATNTLSILVVFGVYVFLAQYLQLVLGLSPLAAGLWLVPSAIASVAGSLLAPVLASRARPPTVIAASLAVACAGLAMFSLIAGLPGVVLGSVLLSLGLVPVPTVAAAIVVGSAPAAQAGVAAGINETSSELGGALGIALLGSLGTALYHSALGDAGPAADTLASAVAFAAGHPGASVSLDAARLAWVHAFERTALVGAAILVAAAILAVVLLQRASVVPDDAADAADARDATDAAGPACASAAATSA
ncbi:MAG TPA: MFS transporter [Kofleriaceae bacterium]|nr:MFS transporter [Kofleriaceae bacterium]